MGNPDGELEGPTDGELEGPADGELEGPADDSEEGPEEGGLLKLGFLDGEQEGCAKRPGDEPRVPTHSPTLPSTHPPTGNWMATHPPRKNSHHCHRAASAGVWPRIGQARMEDQIGFGEKMRTSIKKVARTSCWAFHQCSHLMVLPSGPVSTLPLPRIRPTRTGNSPRSSKSRSDWLWRENSHFNQESGKDELLGIPPMFASDGSAEWSCLHTPLAKDQANSNWHFVVSQLLQVKI
jgi:hypothetical protein